MLLCGTPLLDVASFSLAPTCPVWAASVHCPTVGTFELTAGSRVGQQKDVRGGSSSNTTFTDVRGGSLVLHPL
jgi:hypothetical protein